MIEPPVAKWNDAPHNQEGALESLPSSSSSSSPAVDGALVGGAVMLSSITSTHPPHKGGAKPCKLVHSAGAVAPVKAAA
eukprot:CAMPEP_0172466276 /NCGR_PEP_ID=MMETSP1065-20121228/55685_1 /TAXON_ID=265537 /ORGANISM="Amphiprora paludosa, Strain CCMP125" /LENGTH=78 /DNA_ID=CAMNT_0013223031 /DNA_START=25 /DNA_END=258 /DNA_ORIENTATION=-